MPDKSTPYAISLVLHQTDKPIGWRIHLHPNGPETGYPLTVKQAETLAREVTTIVGIDDQDSQTMTPYQVVRSGTDTLRNILEAELADAEAKAATIANLRTLRAELDS